MIPGEGWIISEMYERLKGRISAMQGIILELDQVKHVLGELPFITRIMADAKMTKEVLDELAEKEKARVIADKGKEGV